MIFNIIMDNFYSDTIFWLINSELRKNPFFIWVQTYFMTIKTN